MPQCCEHHNCIEELTANHKEILAKTDELEKAVGMTLDLDKVKEFLEFTENYAEPHHHKEEKVLFPALEKKGIPNEGGPIGVMLAEHEIKRGLVKELRKAVKDVNEDKIKENALAIVSLLRDHIFKEDNILYPCAKDALSEKELADLAGQCEKIKS
ncbi:MAG: hemerythrin domain-containing protein [Candidatus Nealsonbacteria bacterium]|nr:hemerythrin domain-containing protein [Candidatus Nealsonbacteria bacterium]